MEDGAAGGDLTNDDVAGGDVTVVGEAIALEDDSKRADVDADDAIEVLFC